MLVQQVSVRPCSSDFGLYEVAPEKGDVMDVADILNTIQSEYYEIGVDDLPEEVEDISGKIQHEPERVFAVIENGQVNYFGLVSVEKNFETEFEGVAFTATLYSDRIEFSADEADLEELAIVVIEAQELVASDGFVEVIPEQRETDSAVWWKYANALAQWVSQLLKDQGLVSDPKTIVEAMGTDCWEPYGTLKFEVEE